MEFESIFQLLEFWMDFQENDPPMKQMYPAPLDRYRIAHILLADYIDRNGGAQKVSALSLKKGRDGGRDKSAVYNLRNIGYLEDQARDRKNAAGRETVRELIESTLGMPELDADVLVWLSLSNKAFSKVKKYQEERFNDSQALRKRALELLQDVYDRGTAVRAKEHQIRMQRVVTDENQLKVGEELVTFEKKQGHRMTTMLYPSHVTFPENIIDSDQLLYKVELEKDKKKARRLRLERWHAFRQQINDYGGRDIYSKPWVERYAQEENSARRASLEQRQDHIRELISLLDKYDDYDIVLTNAEPRHLIVVKSCTDAVVRDLQPDKGNHTNVLYTFFEGQNYVLPLLLAFEHEWDKAWEEITEPSNRKKQFVIDWLKQLIP